MIGDWQTANYAPRDGGLIEARGEDGDLYVVRWETPEQRAEEFGGDQIDYQGGFVSVDGYAIEITHWRRPKSE